MKSWIVLLLAALILPQGEAHAQALTRVAQFFDSMPGRQAWNAVVDSRELRWMSRASIAEAQQMAGLRPDPLMTYPKLLSALEGRSAETVLDLPVFRNLDERLSALRKQAPQLGWQEFARSVPSGDVAASVRDALRPWMRDWGKIDFIGSGGPIMVDRRQFLRLQRRAASDGVEFSFVRGEYEDIRDLALMILEKYPPSRFAYVGVGRSPTPLMGFIREWARFSGEPAVALNLPFSRPKLGGETVAIPPEAMSAHLDRFLPASSELAGRELLLIDLVLSGNGFRGFLADLGAHVRTREAFPRFRPLILETNPGASAGAGIEGAAAISLHAFPTLRRRLAYSIYDGVAEFGRHRVGIDPVDQLRPRRSYAAFGERIRERMEKDPFFSR